MANFIEIEGTFCGKMDVHTYRQTDGPTFEFGFIRSTLSKSQPKNEPAAISYWKKTNIHAI